VDECILFKDIFVKLKARIARLCCVSVVLLYQFLVLRGNAGCFIVFATQLLKFQPLDGSVQGHFKKRVDGASDAWSRNNPGKIKKICKFLYIGSEALSNDFTPK
jgi:hypothetical protein